MQAGASAVVSSLWTVADLSTAVLMERFYHSHLKDGLEPAAALRQAQIWLRKLTRTELLDFLKERNFSRETIREIKLGGELGEKIYESPYYWAGFTFNGL